MIIISKRMITSLLKMKIKDLIKSNQNLVQKLIHLIDNKKQIKLLDLNNLLNHIVSFQKIHQNNLN